MVRERLKDRVEFGSYEDEDIEGVLIIAGCPTACVERTSFAGRRVWTITSPEDAERFIEQVW